VKHRIGETADPLPKKARVYSSWSGSNGLEHVITFFELRPHEMNIGCFSLGGKRHKDDIWSCDWPPALLRSKLKSYDYFFLGQDDQIFWDTYQSLFVAGARQSEARFYRIDNSSPGGLLYPFVAGEE
jgi:hypothetical protein